MSADSTGPGTRAEPTPAGGPRGERITVAAAVIERDGRLLLTRRPDGTHLEGLWEFPGGKCDPHETLEECLRREIIEELGADVQVGEEVFAVEHAYPGKVVRLHFFACTLAGAPRALLGQEMRWVEASRLMELSFPEADRALVERLSGGRAEPRG